MPAAASRDNSLYAKRNVFFNAPAEKVVGPNPAPAPALSI